jgi:hypothetical protein
MIAAAFFVAVSRVMDYKHHPTDVIAGGLIGTITQILNCFGATLIFSEENEPIASRTRKLFIMARNEKVEINMENGITTMVHEMKMNGYHLVDKKQRTSFDKITVLIHSRFVDDRSYIVHETLTEGNDEPDRVVKTQMTQEEVERFEEDWINLWKPEIDSTFFGLTENL